MKGNILIDFTGSMISEVSKIECWLSSLRKEMKGNSKNISISLFSSGKETALVSQFNLSEFKGNLPLGVLGSGDIKLDKTIMKQMMSSKDFFAFISDFYIEKEYLEDLILYHGNKRNMKCFFVSTLPIEDTKKLLNFNLLSNSKFFNLSNVENIEVIPELFKIEEKKKLTL